LGPSDVVTLIVVVFYLSIRFCPTGKLSSASDGNRDRSSLGTALLCRMCDPDGMDWLLDNEKAVTPRQRAISCSPICQCMDSAARHGNVISSAIFAHISALNLAEGISLLHKIPSCATFIDIPFVQPGGLILTILVPFAPTFKVVLVVEATADSASTWELLANVFPLHAVAAEFVDLRILVRRPFRLLLGR